VWGDTKDFLITIQFHQGSTLKPYLFTLVLNVLIEHIQEGASRCLFFAYDIVLLWESREELNGRLKTWWQALETYEFHSSRSNKEYMECTFSKRRSVSSIKVKVEIISYHNLKGKFNQTSVRLTMLYGTKYYTVKNQHKHIVSIE